MVPGVYSSDVAGCETGAGDETGFLPGVPAREKYARL
jgi:hypothetical protein